MRRAETVPSSCSSGCGLPIEIELAKKKLKFTNLSSRHRGISSGVSKAYSEAARVCLDRHHRSPQPFELQDNRRKQQGAADWARPNKRTKDAWANSDDATEAGAY